MKNPRLINGEEPFQVEKRCFTLGPSASGYTLQVNTKYNFGDPIVDADWLDYSDTAILSGYAHVVECSAGCWWRLKNNTGDVYLQL